MIRNRQMIVAALGLAASGAAFAAGPTTDFAIRQVGGPPITDPSLLPPPGAVSLGVPLGAGRTDMSGAISVGAKWGRVTSTYRSPAHNRRVGGVPNSYHLRGRAIDIARAPGVRHHQVAAALRAAGYQLVESLDEGDHSHFAFGHRAPSAARMVPALAADTKARPQLVREATADGKTIFRMVFAPAGRD